MSTVIFNKRVFPENEMKFRRNSHSSSCERIFQKKKLSYIFLILSYYIKLKWNHIWVTLFSGYVNYYMVRRMGNLFYFEMKLKGSFTNDVMQKSTRFLNPFLQTTGPLPSGDVICKRPYCDPKVLQIALRISFTSRK